MTDRGWNAIARSMWTDREFPAERWCERAAWGYLISRARYEDGRDLRRGQVLVSASELATLWQWSPREVSLAIQRFKRRGWLTIERRGPRLAVLTLAAFGRYHPTPDPPDRVRRSRDGSATVARRSRDGLALKDQRVSSPREIEARRSRDGSATVARHSEKNKNKNQNTNHDDRPSTMIRYTADGATRIDVGDDVLAVPSSLVLAMGRDEDGNAYARFAKSGPGKPVTRALRAAGFVFDGDAGEWLATYSRKRAALLGRIHPEGSKIEHRTRAEEGETVEQAPSPEAPRPPTAGEVAAFDAQLEADRLYFARGLLRVVSLTTVDGSTCLELATHDAHLAVSLNAFDEGGRSRRRDELARVWQEANGGEVWIAPVRVTPDVIPIDAERKRRAEA